MKAILICVTFLTLLSYSSDEEEAEKNNPISEKKEIKDSTKFLDNKEILIDIDSLLIDKDIIWFTCKAERVSMMKGFLVFSSPSIKLKDSIGAFHCITDQREPKIINGDSIYSGTWPTVGRNYFIAQRKSNGLITLIGEIKSDSYYLWNPCAYKGTTIFKTVKPDNIISKYFYYKKDKGYTYFKDRIAIKKSVF